MKRLEDNSISSFNALSDTDDIFEQTISYSIATLTSFLGSYQVLLMESNAKAKLQSICSQNKVNNQIYLKKKKLKKLLKNYMFI